MRVVEVIRRKGSEVVTVPPEAVVASLVERLAEHGIGALVVSPDGVTVVGIVSERDVVRHLRGGDAGVLSDPISSIMTAPVHTCRLEDRLEDLMATMTQRRVRHLPVLVDGVLAGIVSIGDVVRFRLEELQSERDELHRYITS